MWPCLCTCASFPKTSKAQRQHFTEALSNRLDVSAENHLWPGLFLHVLYSGIAIVTSATTSISIGLTWGGVVYSWTSAQVLAPLCFGVAGVILFMIYEWSWCQYPWVS